MLVADGSALLQHSGLRRGIEAHHMVLGGLVCQPELVESPVAPWRTRGLPKLRSRYQQRCIPHRAVSRLSPVGLRHRASCDLRSALRCAFTARCRQIPRRSRVLPSCAVRGWRLEAATEAHTRQWTARQCARASHACCCGRIRDGPASLSARLHACNTCVECRNAVQHRDPLPGKLLLEPLSTWRQRRSDGTLGLLLVWSDGASGLSTRCVAVLHVSRDGPPSQRPAARFGGALAGATLSGRRRAATLLARAVRARAPNSQPTADIPETAYGQEGRAVSRASRLTREGHGSGRPTSPRDGTRCRQRASVDAVERSTSFSMHIQVLPMCACA